MSDVITSTPDTATLSEEIGARPGPIDPVTKKVALYTYYRRAIIKAREPSTIIGAVFLLGFLVLTGIPLWVKPWHGVIHLIASLFAIAAKAWRAAGMSWDGMQVVVREYRTRKVRLKTLVETLAQRASPPKREDADRFNGEVLSLIASFVRGHRGDLQETKIFVNLLVEDGDQLVVIARNQAHRVPGARYDKGRMLAWASLRSGNALAVGDMNAHPELAVGGKPKPYRSILVLPIRATDRMLGVVSIDSSLPHHFDLEWEDLERYLQPYLSLLTWTLGARAPEKEDTHAES